MCESFDTCGWPKCCLFLGFIDLVSWRPNSVFQGERERCFQHLRYFLSHVHLMQLATYCHLPSKCPKKNKSILEIFGSNI